MNCWIDFDSQQQQQQQQQGQLNEIISEGRSNFTNDTDEPSSARLFYYSSRYVQLIHFRQNS